MEPADTVRTMSWRPRETQHATHQAEQRVSSETKDSTSSVRSLDFKGSIRAESELVPKPLDKTREQIHKSDNAVTTNGTDDDSGEFSNRNDKVESLCDACTFAFPVGYDRRLHDLSERIVIKAENTKLEPEWVHQEIDKFAGATARSLFQNTKETLTSVFSQEFQNHSATLQSAKQDTTDVKAALVEAQAALIEAQEHHKESSRLAKEEHDGVETSLKQDLENVATSARDAKQEVADLRKKNLQQDAHIKQLSRNVQRKEADVLVMTSENERLRSGRDSLRAAKKDLETLIDQLKLDMDSEKEAKQQLEDKFHDLTRKSSIATSEFARVNNELQSYIKTSERQREQFTTTLSSKTDECEMLTKDKTELELSNNALLQDLDRLKKELINCRQEIDELQTAKVLLERAAETQKKQSEDDMRRLTIHISDAEKAFHLSEQYRLDEQSAYKSSLKSLMEEHKDHVSALNQTHQLKVAGMTREHRNDIAELKAKYEKKITQLTATASDREKELHSTHNKKVDELTTLANEREREFKRIHTSTVAHMDGQIRDLNVLLLEGDHENFRSLLLSTNSLPGKGDAKIKEYFLLVDQLVEKLANTAWKQNPDHWTPQELKQAIRGEGDRSVKKAIVQDILWTVLFQFVFCSPFRMLGDQGRKFELEWQEKCGQGKPHPLYAHVTGVSTYKTFLDPTTANKYYTWPATGILAERWRYLTLKGCHESLSSPLPSSADPRAVIVAGLKQNLGDMSANMTTEVGNVIDLKDNEIATIAKLCKTASVVWLDFQMHRCRIVVCLPGNAEETTAAKVAEFRRNGLKLTAAPQVGRHGNVNGLELQSFSEIRDCAGKTVRIP